MKGSIFLCYDYYMNRIIIITLTITLFISCAGIPDRENYQIPDPQSRNFDGLQIGICHGGNSKSDKEYELLDQLGVSWVRIDFKWNKIERVQGQWDFQNYDDFMDKADAEGMKVLAILDYDTDWLNSDKGKYISPDQLPLFLDFVKKVAARYGSRVGAFEIWNEPNTNRFWTGSDEEFFELTRQSLDVLKEVSPETPVAVGSLFYNPVVRARGYLKKLIQSGVLEKADALSLHPYALSAHVLESRILDARELVANAGYNTPIWITEAGFPTGGSYPNKMKLERQSYAIAESITRLAASGVEMITWYNLFDSKNPENMKRGMSSEAYFGLVRPNYELKPGATAYSILASQLAESLFIPEMINFEGKKVKSLYQAQFTRPDGVNLVVIWSLGPIISVDPGFTSRDIRVINLIDGEERQLVNQVLSVTKEPLLLLLE